jgi:ElaB/YqjD/DUF883 family membrane-anchored ribosome-binding protein
MARYNAKKFFAGIEGYDAEGNLIDDDTTTPEQESSTDDAEGDAAVVDGEGDAQTTEQPEPRIVGDVAVVDAEPLPQEEQEVDSEIQQETVAIEELEEELKDSNQAQDSVEDTSEQIEDTIEDNTPALEKGGLSNESINMIHSMRRRINNNYNIGFGSETFENMFSVESFGKSPSLRLATSRKLMSALSNEAFDIGKKLKAAAVAVVKFIIDILNRIINMVDLQGRKAKKLKERIGKVKGEYKQNVSFESQSIANALVKSTNGGSFTTREFAVALRDKIKYANEIESAIESTFTQANRIGSNVLTQVKSGKPEESKGAGEAVKDFFSNAWKKLTGPKMAKGEVFVGLTMEGEDLTSITKENVQAKNIKFETPELKVLEAIIAVNFDAIEAVKKSRGAFGKIYEAKSKLGDIADDLVSTVEKQHKDNKTIQADARRAANALVSEGRAQLQAFKDMVQACSKGIGVLNNYVEICLSKGTGGKSSGPKEDNVKALPNAS